MTKMYNDLPKIVKIILQVFLGAIVGGIYRILRYVEKKNTTTLVVGVLALIPPIDLFFWILDLISVVTKDKITYCAD